MSGDNPEVFAAEPAGTPISWPVLASRLSRSEAFPCGACGNPFVPWFAPDELWNRVVGGRDATDDPGGMLCANCFLLRADAVVLTSAWSITNAQEVKEMSGARRAAVAIFGWTVAVGCWALVVLIFVLSAMKLYG